jgi:hypothetical protein
LLPLVSGTDLERERSYQSSELTGVFISICGEYYNEVMPKTGGRNRKREKEEINKAEI